ncbi:asparagine synthetase [Dictyostelium discoideum AX4]|uniref:Probable asparagine synthetase [glutamine-hydrolyzing] n=1 Tax=Dictyostelium discoideum TaxID=44689 RepID=ASNS_DICDI|nr:asparagine synthetase [Dictyostelium discoideum AX4]Q54MB4.1 RecName: Full=Probable asparagine synthetase [glutamine-hydrolyzing]; AltName: Full=Glutamine-dependent asparagine synthetase [Dictyostelium discoideum]EAL64408.1 asparagine synthetase [Dictyostelium discoideum AX4]|eukprot:XP_637920.1 asparagine synthetase [Dictyostelium discoideum AX4]
MCGILAILNSLEEASKLRKKALSLSSRLRHRGPDWNGIYQSSDSILTHERLAIVGLENGAQPLLNEDETIALTVNGEIYNHEKLREDLVATGKHTFKTHSDCEPILHLYEDKGDDFVHMLDGDFAFVVYNKKANSFLAARDPIGVVPLYIGWHKDGSIWFSSEMKAIKDDCYKFQPFPPGHYFSSKTKEFVRYYKPNWIMGDSPSGVLKSEEQVLPAIKEAFEQAVVSRMMSDVPYGVLLSGGLDSSLVASIVSRHAEQRVEDHEKSRAWWPRIHSFCIGLKDAPDLKAARDVADYLQTVHHEYHFTVQEGIDALPDVIKHLETYDVTTIRASTPMYFLSRKIKAMGVKMVLSGEGSDEIFGGYLYFHNAPDANEFHVECCRRIKALHSFDCLRANKSTAAWGVEVRVPFLDQRFLDVAMNIDPSHKVCHDDQGKKRMEKYILRKAFETKEGEKPYLPSSVLWRQKEQFSDGVGYSWIDGLKENAENEVSDEEFAKRESYFPDDTPTTKEAFLYRKMFEAIYPGKECMETVQRWIPTWGASQDPSGRAQKVHLSTTE